ncbi:peptidase dimerization domain-containing protein [Aerococcaceae bacterium INB8]|uniref:Peptidase dimerization domain-containing protein n=1 Tax=Ruoffia halotolerans TaxID=2748684 RepID=A0A839A8I2_9LACT|nr:peptidase dimerization domain-containing protein [Ruoffia halotolerans]
MTALLDVTSPEPPEADSPSYDLPNVVLSPHIAGSAGKGYYGAYPEESQDPIAAAGQLINALQTIKSRNVKAVNPAVVSITRVQGGFNHNIIPDKVELEGTLRALMMKQESLFIGRLNKLRTELVQHWM